MFGLLWKDWVDATAPVDEGASLRLACCLLNNGYLMFQYRVLSGNVCEHNRHKQLC